jgi:hypothetical protein
VRCFYCQLLVARRCCMKSGSTSLEEIWGQKGPYFGSNWHWSRDVGCVLGTLWQRSHEINHERSGVTSSVFSKHFSTTTCSKWRLVPPDLDKSESRLWRNFARRKNTGDKCTRGQKRLMLQGSPTGAHTRRQCGMVCAIVRPF